MQKSRRHPSALYWLCFIEGGERFAASAWLSLFALYLSQHRHFSASAAIFVVGAVLAGSYLASWPSGWLADRWLGSQRTALFGSALLGLGYAALWTDAAAGLWAALMLLVVGQGLFRAGIATLLGQLYVVGDARREAGFGLFYVAVNLGYLAGPFCAEELRARLGWQAVFGIGSVALLVCSGLLALDSLSGRRSAASASGGAEALLPHVERARIRALWTVSGIAVVFWGALHQTGTSLPLFAEHHTERHWTLLGFTGEVAPGHFASLHGALALVFTPSLVRALAWLRARRMAPSTPTQFVWGLVATAGAFALMGAASLLGGDRGRVHLLWLVSCYVLVSLAEVLWAALGLSFITQLAPPRLAARMAGLWYASLALGYLLTGALGPLWQRWPHHRYFALLALLCLAAAGTLFASLGRLPLDAGQSSANGAGQPDSKLSSSSASDNKPGRLSDALCLRYHEGSADR